MEWTTVHTYLNEAEAAVALASLEARDIPAQVEPRARSILGFSEVAVMVPTDRLSEAEHVLSGRKPRRVRDGDHKAPVNRTTLDAFRRDLQRWRWGIYATALVFFATGLLLSGNRLSPQLGAGILVVVLVVHYACAGIINRLNCPRCGGYFFSFWDMRWFYARDNCRHCGLSIRP